MHRKLWCNARIEPGWQDRGRRTRRGTGRGVCGDGGNGLGKSTDRCRHGNDIGPYRCGNAVCISDILFCDVRKVLRATSAMMDVPTCEQELPEPVTVTHSKPRALGEVPDEREKLGRIRHQRTT